MEAPIRIQAPHQSQLFRGHSYPSEFFSPRGRDSRITDMSYNRSHQYDVGRNDSPYSNESRSHFAPATASYERQELAHDAADANDRRPQAIHPPHAPSQQTYESSIPGPRFFDDRSTARANLSNSHSGSSYHSHSISAPMSPQRSQNKDASRERGKKVALPSVSNLLASLERPDDGRPFTESESRYPPNDFRGAQYSSPVGRHSSSERPGAPLASYSQPRGNGHSTGSSWSSTFSTDTPPYAHQGYSQPYSPPRPGHEVAPHDHMGRSALNPPPNYREEHLPLGVSHHRSQTLPALPHSHLPPAGTGFVEYPPGRAAVAAPMHPSNDPFYPPHRQTLSGSHHRVNEYNGFDRRYDSGLAPEAYSQTYGHQYYSPQNGSHLTRKRRGNLPKEATKAFKDWFQAHKDSPYPTEEEKQQLCDLTKLNMSQVNNWFINARRRLPRQDARQRVEENSTRVTRGSTEASEESNSTEFPEEVAGVPTPSALRSGTGYET